MNKKVNFGSSVKAESKVNKPEQPKPQTIEEIIMGHLKEHSIAINAISMWIARQDPAVKQAGNVVKWQYELSEFEKHLATRKADYAKKETK